MPQPVFRVVIPARYQATRLPGKVLLNIAGKPMLQHVFECAKRSGAQQVVIATDHEKVKQTAESMGAEVILTSAAHQSGTDRIAEVADILGWSDTDLVVNLQGDEPLMPAELINQVAANLAQCEEN